jgi:hypothetical protein
MDSNHRPNAYQAFAQPLSYATINAYAFYSVSEYYFVINNVKDRNSEEFLV